MHTVTQFSSALGRRWATHEPDQEAVNALHTRMGIDRIFATCLVNRNLTDPQVIDRFLHPSLDQLHSPDLLPDYRFFVDEILRARESKELIYIHGDYDVDGVTSTAIFTRFLEKIGCNVLPHVPHRTKEGYGVHLDTVRAAKESGAKVFLTCDCGIQAHEQLELANQLGMRCLVTDHHNVGPTLPKAIAVVNPHRSDSDYPFAEICGAGVVFKLCAGIAQELGYDLGQYYRAYLDLATLGTVADVMPLVDENRAMVTEGLKNVSVSKKPGLQALLRNSFKNWQPGNRVTTRNIGFGLGPRLNAAGRMDDAALALQLLLTKDENAAELIAEQLEYHNTTRKEQQDRFVEEAKEIVFSNALHEHPIIFVFGRDWHHGVIGLIAGRLQEQFSRPTFVLALDEGGFAKGSARSNHESYHLAEALQRANEHLLGHGGHAQAAGFSVALDRVDAFFEALLHDAQGRIAMDQLVPVDFADAEITLAEWNLSLAEQLATLQPYGAANPEPRFITKDVRLIQKSPLRNPEHIAFTVADETGVKLDGVAFYKGELMSELRVGDKLDLLYTIEVDTYRAPKCKMLVDDFRRVSPDP